MAAGHAVNQKPFADKCRSLCTIFSNTLRVNMRQTIGGMAMELTYLPPSAA